MSGPGLDKDLLKKINNPMWPDVPMPGLGDQYQFTDARSVVANPTLRNPPEPVIIETEGGNYE